LDLNSHGTDLDVLQATATEAGALGDLDDSERAAKRKRLDPALLNGGEHDFELEPEPVKKLREENEELKDRMKQMEEEMQHQRSLLQDILRTQQPAAPTAPMV
jgi:hypothetical protein